MLASAAALVAAAMSVGCGSSGSSPDDSDSADTGVVEAASSDFPATRHRSLELLVQDMQRGPALAPSVTTLTTGPNRFGFGLFDKANKQISDLEVALYYAMGPDETAHGPYPASFKPIKVKPRYKSRNSSDDPDSAKAIYVAELPFRSAGRYLVVAVMLLDDTMVASQPARVKVETSSRVPAIGDRAISIHTPTKASVGGQLSRIETRDPPDTMHTVDFADSLDEGRPAVLLFSTPALCQSRVCAPVTDVAEQVHNGFADKVDFVHMEVYKGNDPSKGLNKQLRDWHLEAEPYAFVVNSQGRIVERLEGAFSVGELEDAARKALR